MIDLNKFKESPQTLKRCIVEFNRRYKIEADKVMSESYIELWKNSTDKELTVLDWRHFFVNYEIVQFYQEELKLVLQARAQSLARAVGGDRSTATVQGLTAILNRVEPEEYRADENKIFVYSFIPLNSIERNVPNTKVLNNIPSEIGDAITSVKGDKKIQG